MQTNPFQAKFLCPKYWGIWFGFGLLRLIGFLPYQKKIVFGEALGRLIFKLASRRRELARKNLQIAFPDKSEDEITQLLKQHFESLGVSLIEITVTAWGKHRHSDDNEQQYFTYYGLENIEQNLDSGILLLVPHFTSMEMSGLMLSFVHDYRPIYRKHDNDLMEYLITKSRTPAKKEDRAQQQYNVSPLFNTDTRTMIKALRAKDILWIAPDQKYGGQGSIEVPFFGTKTPSNPGINKLAKMGKAKVIPCFTRRNGYHYEMHILPPLDNFPSGDDYEDTLRLHHLYETEIQQNPSQYLWVHDRWDIKNNNPHLPERILND